MTFTASLRLGANNVKGETEPATPGDKGNRKGSLETSAPNPKLGAHHGLRAHIRAFRSATSQHGPGYCGNAQDIVLHIA